MFASLVAVLLMWPVVGQGIIVSHSHAPKHHGFSFPGPLNRPWCGRNQIPPYGCGKGPQVH